MGAKMIRLAKQGLVVALIQLLFFSSNALAADTPPPTTVTMAGSLQSEVGCAGDWDPGCAATHLAFDSGDQVWQGTFTIPAGSYEYKVALNDSWDENYGLHATRGGDNIPLNLSGTTSVKFYYSHETHWVTDNHNSVIVVVPGSFQSELGCSGDWDPGCLRSWLQDPDGDGIFTFTTQAIPAGSYEAKVAINESWDENYGAGGIENGANISFSVSEACTDLLFSYDSRTHVLTITNLTSPTSPTGTGAAAPSMVLAGDPTLLTVAVTPGTCPPSTGLTVVCDLSSIGGAATQAFHDDGTSGDATAGDNIFSYTAIVPDTTPDGAKSFPCTISDAEGRTGSASIKLITYHDFSDCYMTGAGKLGGPFAPPLLPGKTVLVDYSFLLSCPDVNNHTTGLTGAQIMPFKPAEPNLLTVFWSGHNTFIMKSPVNIECGTTLWPYFTLIEGEGFGTWNWMPGYKVNFAFWDNFMTGQRDLAALVITQISSGMVMLSAKGNLIAGGHAAHCPMIRAVQR
jgi:hypothetical protein